MAAAGQDQFYRPGEPGCPHLHRPCLAVTSSFPLSSSFSGHFSGFPIGDLLMMLMPGIIPSSGSCLGFESAPSPDSPFDGHRSYPCHLPRMQGLLASVLTPTLPGMTYSKTSNAICTLTLTSNLKFHTPTSSCSLNLSVGVPQTHPTHWHPRCPSTSFPVSESTASSSKLLPTCPGLLPAPPPN